MTNNAITVNVGPLFLVFLVFLALKLAGAIAWSWWWVTAPLWIPFALGLMFFLIGLLLAVTFDR